MYHYSALMRAHGANNLSLIILGSGWEYAKFCIIHLLINVGTFSIIKMATYDHRPIYKPNRLNLNFI